jgi:hypothetical protein
MHVHGSSAGAGGRTLLALATVAHASTGADPARRAWTTVAVERMSAAGLLQLRVPAVLSAPIRAQARAADRAEVGAAAMAADAAASSNSSRFQILKLKPPVSYETGGFVSGRQTRARRAHEGREELRPFGWQADATGFKHVM